MKEYIGNYEKNNRLIIEKIKECGIEVFSILILEYCTIENLIIREDFYLKKNLNLLLN